jgi:CDP-diacylglycerol--serine O-phosphatidyltransferase
VKPLRERSFVRRRRRRLPRPERRRAIYLLPNLITTGSLMLGFYSMTRALAGDYIPAALAIIAAGVLDMMDGRIARATHSTSRFGVEYDSLTDLVSFGIAPALLTYVSVLSHLGKRGWAIGGLYAVCAALRLARYNVQREVVERTHNYGLPSTIAGGMVATTIWFVTDLELSPATDPSVRVALTFGFVALALLMVSGVPYASWKSLPTTGRHAFTTLVTLVVLSILALVNEIRGFFALGLLYLLSGPALWLWMRAHGEVSGVPVVKPTTTPAPTHDGGEH